MRRGQITCTCTFHTCNHPAHQPLILGSNNVPLINQSCQLQAVELDKYTLQRKQETRDTRLQTQDVANNCSCIRGQVCLWQWRLLRRSIQPQSTPSCQQRGIGRTFCVWKRQRPHRALVRSSAHPSWAPAFQGEVCSAHAAF